MNDFDRRMQRQSSERAFRVAWRLAAELGMCDEADGVEYTRVHAEWLWRGAPPEVELFIEERANSGPQD